MRSTKKNKKKNIAGKIFFIFRNELVFFRNVFLSPEIDCFFGNRQQSNARAGHNKTTCFFVNARPKSNARAYLKHRKKT